MLPVSVVLGQNVLSGIHPTNKIVDNIGVSHALFQGLCVSEVIFLGDYKQGLVRN
jgi:hypothetical protein